MVGHFASFCADTGWPRGELNLPRALVTEKAFPENEAVLTTGITPKGPAARRATSSCTSTVLASAARYEVVVPFEMQEADGGQWRRGIGDIAVAYKHVLLHQPASAERS